MINCKQCQELLLLNKKLRDALEFYANRKHYEIDAELDRRKISLDRGERARKALNAE